MAMTNKEISKDFKTESLNISDKEKEKDEISITNGIFGIMIILTFLGSITLVYKSIEYTESFKQYNSSYNFPKVSDLKITLFCLPFFIVKYFIKYF